MGGTKWVEQPRRQSSKRSEAELEMPVSVERAGYAVETSQRVAYMEILQWHRGIMS